MALCDEKKKKGEASFVPVSGSAAEEKDLARRSILMKKDFINTKGKGQDLVDERASILKEKAKSIEDNEKESLPNTLNLR